MKEWTRVNLSVKTSIDVESSSPNSFFLLNLKSYSGAETFQAKIASMGHWYNQTVPFLLVEHESI